MQKLKYALVYAAIGAAIGIGIDFLVGLTGAFFNEMTCGFSNELIDCDGSMSEKSIHFYIIVMAISIIIGLLTGISKGKEAALIERKRQEEIALAEKRRQEEIALAEKRRQEEIALAEKRRQWDEAKKRKAEKIKKEKIVIDTKELLKNIENDSYHMYGSYETVYKKIFNSKKKFSHLGEEYSLLFDQLINRHVQSLKSRIHNTLKCFYDENIPNDILESLLHEITLLKYASKVDCGYDLAINTIKKYMQFKYIPFHYIKQNSYGNFTFPLDNQKTMIEIKKNIQKLEEKQLHMKNNLSNNSDGYYCGIVDNLTEEFAVLSAQIMWYYAKKEPFSIIDFNRSCFDYEKYVTMGRDNVEIILAKVYSKFQMGGSDLVDQDKGVIEEWLEESSEIPSAINNELFASGLAWMGLYEMEKNVLGLMIKNNQELSSEAQEHLKFLKNNNLMNIKIYEPQPTDDFLFNTSSEKWNESEFETFFYLIGAKKISLNYSLAISSWKKILPLTLEQHFDQDKVFQEFKKVVKSFNNEVTLKKMTVRAVDLDNVIYRDSAVFSFTSERNKCLTIVFFCDVFGPTLNITILTLFTPEEGMSIESMQKYAKAIKGNIYVDSFREIILQSVDETLKEKREIYSDEKPLSSKKFVE